MSKPNCYECKHRRNIPGDAHSSCAHPLVNIGGGTDIVSAIVEMFSVRSPNDLLQAIDTMGIKCNAHGLRSGWFLWPFNFDPVWLESCNSFEQK